MVGVSRTEERRAALRFCLLTLGWLAVTFVWASLLSFDIADPPSTTVWPHHQPPANWCGYLGAFLAYHTITWLGVGAFPLAALLTLLLIAVVRRIPMTDPELRALGLVLVCAAGATLGALFLPPNEGYLITGPGGIVGTALAEILLQLAQFFGTLLIVSLAGLVGLVLAADQLLVALFRWLRWASEHSGPVLARGGEAVANAGGAILGGERRTSAAALPKPAPTPERADRATDEPREVPPARRAIVEPGRAALEAVPASHTHEGEERSAGADTHGPSVISLRRERPPQAESSSSREPKRERPDGSRADQRDKDYQLPPLDLLDRPIPLDRSVIENACREKAYVLEQTLNEFRLAVQVVSIETGPVITVFELKLAPGIKVNQIASLANDMARALKAPAVRVVAPLAGKNTIGIEVPNLDKEKVRLRDLISQSAGKTDTMALPLFLGKDASGQPLVADLTRMPHLLIAGTTGSGKSVCVNSIIHSILLTRSPAEVQLILVDPKVVELAAYRDLPHLMCPIVTEVAKAEGILDWASTKMDERYALLAEAGVKDIRSYNKLGEATLRERLQVTSAEEMAAIPVQLPYIVIMIDELADLMMMSPKEVEFFLCRIAQKSRAVGIHLIVSTQRPQANVVTGLIKSNLPSRIAFRVASRLDSRIVLDQNGAEVLMGQGDLLFLPPGSSKLVRAQGTFVDDDELRRVVKHCREQRSPEFHPELVRIPAKDAVADSERDELFDAAVDLILESGRGSVSLLQRRLTIGYGRASRLIDQMYASGIVGEYKGSQAREVIVTKDEWESIKSQRDREKENATQE